ncbi:DUF2189 domain-containing protein [uncultured Erythrobacter sp.]|uniref:DUF2189 domain-containing protein n=1 Tax=uncultured Erythrobacter sp. TaxID=263913 RepID=UPI0026037039|nr:DUF2189 domain-containing protein [uncultured Erythrobacter sp.]
MVERIENQSAPPEVARDLSFADLREALAAGWSDFRNQPAFGLFFAAIFVVGGLALTYFLVGRGEYTWAIPAAAGFPLLAPFTAVGLYEVSRRRELGLAMSWGGILGAVRGRGDEQILAMGVIIFVAFGFWVIVAHAIFSIAIVEAGAGSESLAFLATDTGLIMLAIGSAVGAVMALVFYAITVISLPMLVDREVDFLTAIIASLAAFRANAAVMIVWAAIIAALLFLAMVPAFLGLLVVLPVLGHATWHLYRRAIRPAVLSI